MEDMEEFQPIKLTLETVIKNGLEYYNNKKLSAQHPDPKNRQCANFVDDGYRCIVAASFPKEWEDNVHFGTIEAGVRLGYVIIDSQIEAMKIARLQAYHDLWARAAMTENEDIAKFVEESMVSSLKYLRDTDYTADLS
jgi:hypothetical protein